MSAKKKSTAPDGIKFDRRFTRKEAHPFTTIEWDERVTSITNPDGSVVFHMDNIEVPKSWSQLATDIVSSKYFRKAGVPDTDREISVKQVVYRIAHTIRTTGERLGNYFADEANAETFEMELTHMLINQYGAFNSPVWFNCGLYHEYGIKGSGGNHYFKPETGQIELSDNSYAYPQCSACFIQSVDDDLMSIFDLAKNEARLFKYGSGTGTNFSKIRGRQEMLSGGGTSSGLMSFLEVLDRGAGATKSGGTTRRAAKMCCLEMDHPEIVDFINWKVKEERKVAALIAAGYSSDFNGDAYRTVGGQNSNNSVRISNDFIKAYQDDGSWQTRMRTNGAVCETFRARELMDQICFAAWACADPGVQFDTIINDWHTCPQSAPIRSSNPCSEFMFIDDSACNLASINLMKFHNEDGTFDIAGFQHACRIFILAQEIIVDMSAYPTKQIAQNSHDFRPLGLGYANLGTLLMVNGIPYDSPQGNALCSTLTALMTGTAYLASAEIASHKGTFAKYEENRVSMLRVMRKHQAELFKIDFGYVRSDLFSAAQTVWQEVIREGERHGFRNAQVSVLAPTGTIGLLMDCDTTGVEPEFALVKFKKLAGGGYLKIVNQSVPMALNKLGYSREQIHRIITYAKGTGTLIGTPHINPDSLRAKGLSDTDLSKIEAQLPSAFDIAFVFNKYTLGEEALNRLGFLPVNYNDPKFNLLRALGFNGEQIEEANRTICGMMTIEGSPELEDKHLAVFDCASKNGRYGKRYIEPMGHVRMMAAAQAFISGAISKTVNLPNDATVDDIRNIYFQGWKLGLKGIALYRDGCKLSQPLNSTSEDKDQPTSKTIIETKVIDPTAKEVWAKKIHRRRLPVKRRGFTQQAKVGGHKVYVRTGEYEDGTLGEIFVDMHKEGSSFRSVLNCFAMTVSLGLQHGVPLEEFVDMFTFTRFEPQGIVMDHPNIKFATSIIDYIFRMLAFEYLGRSDLVQSKPEELIAPTELDPSVTKPISLPVVSIDIKPRGNGNNGNGKNSTPAIEINHPVKTPVLVTTAIAKEYDSIGTATMNPVDMQLGEMLGDAPFCDQCGHITIRNGACYKCVNCGNSMGCS